MLSFSAVSSGFSWQGCGLHILIEQRKADVLLQSPRLPLQTYPLPPRPPPPSVIKIAKSPSPLPTPARPPPPPPPPPAKIPSAASLFLLMGVKQREACSSRYWFCEPLCAEVACQTQGGVHASLEDSKVHAQGFDCPATNRGSQADAVDVCNNTPKHSLVVPLLMHIATSECKRQHTMSATMLATSISQSCQTLMVTHVCVS